MELLASSVNKYIKPPIRKRQAATKLASFKKSSFIDE